MVPLTLKLRYKGFDCLVEPTYRFETCPVAFGKKEGDIFYQSIQVQEAMVKLGRYLNLKNHSVKGRSAPDSASGEILMSQNVQVISTNKLGYEHLIVNKNQKIMEETKKLGLKDCNLTLPRQSSTWRSFLHTKIRIDISCRL